MRCSVTRDELESCLERSSHGADRVVYAELFVADQRVPTCKECGRVVGEHQASAFVDGDSKTHHEAGDRGSDGSGGARSGSLFHRLRDSSATATPVEGAVNSTGAEMVVPVSAPDDNDEDYVQNYKDEDEGAAETDQLIHRQGMFSNRSLASAGSLTSSFGSKNVRGSGRRVRSLTLESHRPDTFIVTHEESSDNLGNTNNASFVSNSLLSEGVSSGRSPFRSINDGRSDQYPTNLQLGSAENNDTDAIVHDNTWSMIGAGLCAAASLAAGVLIYCLGWHPAAYTATGVLFLIALVVAPTVRTQEIKFCKNEARIHVTRVYWLPCCCEQEVFEFEAADVLDVNVRAAKGASNCCPH